VPRILIADDHPGVRRHVRRALEKEEGWEVCGEAETGWDAVMMTEAVRPDFVVLDLSMPQLNGLQAAKQIHARFPEIEMLILTMYEGQELMQEAVASGAHTCIMKTELDNLITVVRRIWQRRSSAPLDDRCGPKIA